VNLSELPGSELILTGLDDLRNGETGSIGALLIAIASKRLAAAGLDFPQEHLASEPELTLYAHLQRERDDADPYYNALLNSLNSFCNALELSHQSTQAPSTKLTKEQARALVVEQVCPGPKWLPSEDEIMIIDQATIEKPWGWVFFYTSKLWYETQDIRYAVAGNAPIIVEKVTGRVIPTGTAKAIEYYIENYERSGDPYG
jgi:Immunity protein 35